MVLSFELVLKSHVIPNNETDHDDKLQNLKKESGGHSSKNWLFSLVIRWQDNGCKRIVQGNPGNNGSSDIFDLFRRPVIGKLNRENIWNGVSQQTEDDWKLVASLWVFENVTNRVT